MLLKACGGSPLCARRVIIASFSSPTSHAPHRRLTFSSALSDSPKLTPNMATDPAAPASEFHVSSGKTLYFPVKDYLPKDVTQQATFLKKYPEYDGRGVKIAILDTGVDPGLPGLLTTTTGLPKIIDCMDLTGAGDVDTSIVRQIQPDGTLIGATGRRLKIPDSWVNPSGKWHVGLKAIYELYPARVKKTILTEKYEYDKADHRLAIADVMRRIDKHEKEVGGTSTSLSDKEDREDLNYQHEYLKKLKKDDFATSPVVDVIVWKDDKFKWRACLDTSFRGKLNTLTVMTNFRDEGKFARLSERDQINYCVTIHNEGNVLEICVPSGSHGTHVASIAAAHCPNSPEENGLAPGAQIINMCIGDLRINCMETGQALTRAFNKCIEMGVDIVNYSFGETSAFTEAGEVNSALRRMVEDHGIIFVSSAGNNGPALSTVGSPGATHSAVIGVGAYLTPEMMKAMYSARDELPPAMFNWSSRGPTLNGALGVSVSAPGAAITGVPLHSLRGTELMNGTSMSSPNACGTIACLLSAMKALKIPISPLRIRIALENTALFPKEGSHYKLSIGHGLVQVDAAFEFVKRHLARVPPELAAIKISVNDEKERSARGIYLREAWEFDKARDYPVTVTAIFKKDCNNEVKINFERNLRLAVARGGDKFVAAPQYFKMSSGSGHFTLHVNPTTLSMGQVHYTEVIAYDSQHPEMGPIFRIPVTATVPIDVTEPEDYSDTRTLELGPAEPDHFFARAPRGSSYAVLKLQYFEDVNITVNVHIVRLIEDKPLREVELSRTVSLYSNCEEVCIPFAVYPERTFEICIAKLWKNLGVSTVHWNLKFYGYTVYPQVLFSDAQFNRIDFVNGLRCCTVTPFIAFDKYHMPVYPTESKVQPMTERDLFVGMRQMFRLIVCFKFHVPTTCDYSFGFNGLTDFLYESVVDCVLFNVYNGTKQYMGTSACYPNRASNNFHLPKGDYVVQAQIRHDNPRVLEGLRDVCLIVQHKITTAKGDLYATPHATVDKRCSKASARMFNIGQRGVYYMAPLLDEVVPKMGVPGGYLTGGLTLDSGRKGEVASTSSVKYILTEFNKRSNKALSTVVVEPKKKDAEGPKDEEQEEKDIAIALRDAKIKLLGTIKSDFLARKLFGELYADFSEHLPLLLAEVERRSRCATTVPDRQDLLSLIQEVVDLCKADEVLHYFGANLDNNEEDLLRNAEMTTRKNAIIEVLFTKANFLLNEHLRVSSAVVPKIFRNSLRIGKAPPKSKSSEASNESANASFASVGDANQSVSEPMDVVSPLAGDDIYNVTRKEADNAFREYMRWVEPKTDNALLLTAKHAVSFGRCGTALRCLTKIMEEKTASYQYKDIEVAIAEVMDQLAWYHLSALKKNEVLIKYRYEYRNF